MIILLFELVLGSCAITTSDGVQSAPSVSFVSLPPGEKFERVAEYDAPKGCKFFSQFIDSVDVGDGRISIGMLCDRSDSVLSQAREIVLDGRDLGVLRLISDTTAVTCMGLPGKLHSPSRFVLGCPGVERLSSDKQTTVPGWVNLNDETIDALGWVEIWVVDYATGDLGSRIERFESSSEFPRYFVDGLFSDSDGTVFVSYSRREGGIDPAP